MSNTTQDEELVEWAIQGQEDVGAICKAIRDVMRMKHLTSGEVAEIMHTSDSNVRRMMTQQEPKISFVAAFERALDLQLGTLYRMAGLAAIDKNPEEMLASDPRLHPVYQRAAPEMVQTWVRLSAEEKS